MSDGAKATDRELTENERALQLAATMVATMRERYKLSADEMNLALSIAMEVNRRAWEGDTEAARIVLDAVGEIAAGVSAIAARRGVKTAH